MSIEPIENFPFERRIPDADDRERLVCTDCNWIHYENPRIIVGVVCTWEDTILLCKRAIEPRVGYWTIPAGFMEVGETAEDGAKRETHEEAGAEIEIDALLGVYSIPRIGQVQLIYRAQMLSPDLNPGFETSDTQFVTYDNIPWDELAFPSVHWSLKHHQQSLGQTTFVPFSAPLIQGDSL